MFNSLSVTVQAHKHTDKRTDKKTIPYFPALLCIISASYRPTVTEFASDMCAPTHRFKSSLAYEVTFQGHRGQNVKIKFWVKLYIETRNLITGHCGVLY